VRNETIFLDNYMLTLYDAVVCMDIEKSIEKDIEKSIEKKKWK